MDYLREARGVLKAWVRHERAKLRQLSLAAAADRLARRVRRLEALFRGFDPNEPRDESGRWTTGGGGGHGGADQGEGRQRQRHPMPPREREKRFRMAKRYRSPAVRRLVLAGVAREGQVAAAVRGVNLLDSEPADVVVARDANGEAVSTVEGVRKVMAQREHAVKVLRSKQSTAEQKAAAEKVLGQVFELIEVKTILRSPRNAVRMTSAAKRRKERWRERFGAEFHVVALDDRRGKRHTGHRVYVAAATLAGHLPLSRMDRVDSLADVLGFIQGATR
jgi:hypothetical protein